MSEEPRPCPDCPDEPEFVYERQVRDLQARIKKLEHQRKGYGELLGSANNDVERLQKWGATLQAQIQQYQSTEPYDSGKAAGIASVASKLADALKALEEYGYHTNACPATTEHILEPIETGEKCNCGYAQALGDK